MDLDPIPASVICRSSAAGTHERAVADFYGRDIERRLRLKSVPYHNMGYWKHGPADMDEAGNALLRLALETAGVTADDVVLDAGCGFGISVLDIRRQTGCRRVIGIDIAPSLVEYGQSVLAARVPGEPIEIRLMNATHMVFEDDAFTKVIAVDSALHFLPRDRFFREAFRVLQSGGVLATVDAVIPRAPRTAVERKVINVLMNFWHVPSVNRYDVTGYAERLKGAGFGDVRVSPLGRDVVLSGAAHMLAPDFRRRYRQQFGAIKTALRMGILQLVLWSHRRNLVDYVLAIARK